MVAVPHVLLELPDGTRVRVEPGGVVGRSSRAVARLTDPRISEAHLLVSLRGQAFHLLGLRGTLCVEGARVREALACEGLVVELAPGVRVRVVAVSLPERVLVLRLAGQLPRELCAPLYSFVASPEAQLVPHYVAGAPCRIWQEGQQWVRQLGSDLPQPLAPGDRWTVGSHELRVEELPLCEVGAASTAGPETQWERLRIVARFSTVHIDLGGREPVVLNGQPARLISELAVARSPMPWAIVAGEIWPHIDDTSHLRSLWDGVVRRIRLTLRAHGMRPNLVRHDHCGNIELFLLPGDELVDEA